MPKPGSHSELSLPLGTHMAAIALGSNLPSMLGDGPEQNLKLGIMGLTALGTIWQVSSFHTTEPVGYTEQPDFLNAALTLQTPLSPRDLMRGMFEIERSLGRIRDAAVPKGPRVIDLDLIFYDNIILNDPELTIPHPAMHVRMFVLAPLAEIAPGWMHPVLLRTVSDLSHQVRPPMQAGPKTRPQVG